MSETGFVRDGVIESSSFGVLRAPLDDPSLDMAVCRRPVPPDLSRFFSSPDWRRSCYELFKSVIDSGKYNAGDQTRLILPLEHDFFAEYTKHDVKREQPLIRSASIFDTCLTANQKHHTKIAMENNYWDAFVVCLTEYKNHPFVNFISDRRQKIIDAYKCPTASVEIRFEDTNLFSDLYPAHGWHQDGNMGGIRRRICGVVKGSGMEFIRRPYVNFAEYERLTRSYQHLCPEKIKKKEFRTVEKDIACPMHRLRFLLGKEFDATRDIATDLSKVEALRPGDLACIAPTNAQTTGIIHRQPLILSETRVYVQFVPQPEL